MREESYWDKLWRRKLSRRRLLAGTMLAGGGLAAASIVGCGGATPGRTGNTGAPAGSDWDEWVASQNPTYPSDGRRQFSVPPANSRGGKLVYIGFDPVVLDRYDPHQTQFGPMYSNQSAVFSKLYRYASHEEPTWDNILPDLAESAPEMIGDPPDTYIIKLRRGVKYHNSEMARKNFPKLAGRELTADDVIFSFNRQRNPDSKQRAYYYRSSQYGTIDTIEKIDDYTIKIVTKGPVAPFYHFLADTNAMIIPPEIVDMEPAPGDTKPWDSVDAYGDREPKPAARMIGTGPFMWDTLKFGIEFIAVRNPEWFGWDQPELGRPYLDAYKATGQGLNDATIESLFRRKEIDAAGFVDNPQWIKNIKAEFPELEIQKQQVSGWVNSRLKVYCKPFDDWRVRRALHLAVDRQQVVDVIGSGTWKKVGPVGSAVKYWALPDEELLKLPGYRFGPEREEDLKEARQLYEAAGKPEIPMIWFADVPDYIRRFATTYIESIRKVLGMESQIKFQTLPYSRIAEGLLKEECDQAPMTWGFDNGWIDLDDWVYPYFKTGGPKNSFKVSDPDLDLLLDAQRREFDVDKRRDLGYQIQRYILGVTKKDAPGTLCRIEYAAPGGGSISWPYLKNRTSWPWFGNQYWAANIWIDKNDPSYSGRPS